MKVVFREEALRDLDRIYSWIAKDRPAAADSVIDRILACAERLSHFPFVGHRGRGGRSYERVVPGLPYVLVYEIHQQSGEITVIAVFHGAQDRP